MKIGVDAKWLFTGTISGRLFIHNVLNELLLSYPEIEWHIFINKKEKNLELPFRDRKITVHYVWAGFNMLSNLFILPRHAKRLKLDAVFFQTFSSKRRSFKSVVFIHDVLFDRYPEFFTWKERLYFKPLKWTAPGADRIITTTRYVQSELIRLKYARNNHAMDLAPSGVSGVFKPAKCYDRALLEKIRQKHKLPVSYILFVGRLNARKNIETLIESLRFVNDVNTYLVIVGEKEWKTSRIEHLLQDHGFASRIIFTGSVENDELSAIYAMAKIFCFPSYAEGMGLPPLEAMACGVPTVVSNTTSMPEVCGNAALYADPGDPKSIGQKINELLQDNALYHQKAQEGLEWSQNFTWKRTAKRIMESIFEATAESKVPNL
jgi:glycosyltransferase involved in cell wall biosynthesis